MQVLLVNCAGGRIAQLGRALEARNSLAELWTSEKNRTGISPEKFRRAWAFHVAMKPFYHLTPAGFRERIYHALFPLWRSWVNGQAPNNFDVAHGMMGYATEPFELAEKRGALKVIDAGSSHPTSFYGFWQRECDLWCPGAVPGVPRWLFARCNRELERADLIICPSLFVRESMVYNGIPESKCVICPYGVDATVFTPREAVPTKPRFVSVGAICVRKGHPYLFRAFEKARAALGDAELICVGTIFPDVKLEIARWKGTFMHREYLSHTELANVLRQATAFVLPSNEEGLAKAIIEAMACGLPIVATHESGATTLVDNGVEGIIVKTRDADSLAQAMVKLASDKSLNEKMGRAARQKGTTNNSWGDYAERLLRIYAQARKAPKSGESAESRSAPVLR
jgi:starch synthase